VGLNSLWMLCFQHCHHKGALILSNRTFSKASLIWVAIVVIWSVTPRLHQIAFFKRTDRLKVLPIYFPIGGIRPDLTLQNGWKQVPIWVAKSSIHLTRAIFAFHMREPVRVTRTHRVRKYQSCLPLHLSLQPVPRTPSNACHSLAQGDDALSGGKDDQRVFSKYFLYSSNFFKNLNPRQPSNQISSNQITIKSTSRFAPESLVKHKIG